MKSLDRYLFLELIPPFVLNLVFFMFVFLMRQILDITNMIVNYQVGILAFAFMLLFSMPFFLIYIIPMSVMMAVLLTFLRMSGDNEIVALKAGGISLYRMLPPVVLFSLVCTLITLFMAVYGMPWGQQAYKRLALEVAQSNFNLGIKARQFNDSFEGVMFYVNEVDTKTRALKDIFIEDQREAGASSTVVAPRGNLLSGAEPYSFVLRLYNGTINRVNLKDKTAHTISFDTYDLRLDLSQAVSAVRRGKRSAKEMSLSELREQLKSTPRKDQRYYSLLLEFHKKWSIPFACIALGILAAPLGVQSNTSRRTAGLGIGLTAFLIYYLMLSAGLVFGETGNYPPLIGMWVPNIIMGGAGIYLLVKTANDRPIGLLEILKKWRRRLENLIRRWVAFK